MGLDEAGRGAVIGPLVICGLVIDEEKEVELKKIGVRDSKELTPKRREELAQEIEKIAENIIILHVSACNIDSMRKNGINLNQIEAMKMAEAINMILPEKVIIDTPSYNSDKFRSFLNSKLIEEAKKAKFIFENYADKKYPVVSAASIIAKVERDKKIEELKKKFNFDFGVGYSHDARTIEFLEKLARENNGKMPKNIRASWETVREIMKKYEQRGLRGFLDKFKKL
ncbi:MAG: ribonuclease HII [Candidatus Aenigmarchaeota archaeon]|nr:ribonuclease HII [Candidatus Aenigmarchaeota archaeon]